MDAGIWSGLITNDYVKSIEVDYTFEDVIDWCENLEENKRTLRKLTPDHLIALYLRIDSSHIREEVHNKLMSLRLSEDVAALVALADRLDDPTPIPMKIDIF